MSPEQEPELEDPNILLPSEKAEIIRDYSQIMNDYSLSVAKHADFFKYGEMVQKLSSYLETLTGWNEVPGKAVKIDLEEFRKHFHDVYFWQQKLKNKEGRS